MGGKLSVTSKEGEGATFTLKIPMSVVAKEDYSQRVELNEEDELLFTGHILVAEDNKTNQMLIKILLEDYGLSYEIANDGLEAVSMFKEGKYDLILMDENMPNLNGIEAMLQIKEYEQEIQGSVTPIIALTANALNSDRENFLKVGMDGFVAKPIETEVLEAEFSKYLKLQE